MYIYKMPKADVAALNLHIRWTNWKKQAWLERIQGYTLQSESEICPPPKDIVWDRTLWENW